MAALKLLLSEARRHYLTKHLHSSLPLTFHRSLSSSSSSPSNDSDSNPLPPQQQQQNPPTTPTRFQSVPIQPVSYPIKPKDPPPEAPSLSQPQSLNQPPPVPPRGPAPPSPQGVESRQAWTREDIRYVKDAPSIAPVSYPIKVAPLPDDNVAASIASEEVEIERRRIEAMDQMKTKIAMAAEEERRKVPFPMLIKPKKNEKPPVFDLNEAIRQVKATAKAKFDETVELHVRLGIDPKRTELAVRGTVILPHGAPKAVSVAVFAEGAEAEEARAAGADIVGGKELIEEVASGNNKLKVEKCFSTPGMAPHLGKIAQYLRKRRLMPDKKLGTLTNDIAGQLKELRQGRVEFKMESKSILHLGVGKVSYTEESLRENIGAFMNAVLLAKPAGLKKTSKYAGYVLSVDICSTMGPGLPVSIQSISKAADNYKKVHVV
ncbi:hypothetical protein RIF29_31251 [Crotalaria pallida]|uniref:CL1 n=1 Tax=Crotalaria pallida TaxID=3830 RepID=A0AAN9EHS2_CROPI